MSWFFFQAHTRLPFGCYIQRVRKFVRAFLGRGGGLVFLTAFPQHPCRPGRRLSPHQVAARCLDFPSPLHFHRQTICRKRKTAARFFPVASCAAKQPSRTHARENEHQSHLNPKFQTEETMSLPIAPLRPVLDSESQPPQFEHSRSILERDARQLDARDFLTARARRYQSIENFCPLVLALVHCNAFDRRRTCVPAALKSSASRKRLPA
jgi:hypothetical protein